MKKSYYAIIPANVRYDKRLTDGAKLLYGEITALCNETGRCWATNSYFAKLYEVSNVTISNWISQLEKLGYIKREIKYKGGTKEIDKRYLNILYDPIKENFNTPIKENFKENNTKIFNNTSNNTSNIPYVEIINYLNETANKKYRSTTRKTKELIKARFNEGFTVDDFKRVIDIKNNEWKNDAKMSKFIRPDTLFGTKFEGYLNQEDRSITNDGYDY